MAYFSSKLDPVTAGLPGCFHAVAAAEKAVLVSRDIVGYSDLTLVVPHAIALILLEQKTYHLSMARWINPEALSSLTIVEEGAAMKMIKNKNSLYSRTKTEKAINDDK